MYIQESKFLFYSKCPILNLSIWFFTFKYSIYLNISIPNPTQRWKWPIHLLNPDYGRCRTLSKLNEINAFILLVIIYVYIPSWLVIFESPGTTTTAKKKSNKISVQFWVNSLFIAHLRFLDSVAHAAQKELNL